MKSKHAIFFKQLSLSAAVLAGLLLSAPIVGQQGSALADSTSQVSSNASVNTTFTGTIYRNTPSTQSVTSPQIANGFEHSLYFQATDKSGNLQDSNYAVDPETSTPLKTIINSDNYKDLTLNFTINNNTTDDKIVNEIVCLPKYSDDSTPLVFDNDRGHSTIAPESGSQSSMALTAYIDKHEYSLDAIPAGSDWSTMDRFRVKGTLSAGQHWSIKIPLKLNITDATALDEYLYDSKWAQVVDNSYAPNSYSGPTLTTYIRIAQQDSLNGGKYLATIENNDGSFTPLPQNVEDLMPQIGANGEVIWDNLYDGSYGSGSVQGDAQTALFKKLDTVGFTGSYFYLDLQKLGAVKSANGYTLERNLQALGYDFAPDSTTNKTATSYYYRFSGVTPNITGGNGGGMGTNGIGSINLRLYKVTPVPLPAKPNNGGNGSSSSNTSTTTNTTPSTNNTWNPTTPKQTDGSTGLPNYASVKGAAVYATKAIYMYRTPNFTKHNRVAKYTKKARVNRPMFVVTGYARSNNGALRYKVRDVNKGAKTYGKTGYITANKNYVSGVYYRTLPKNKHLTVIAKKGGNAYRTASLTGKSNHYKKGARLHVKRLVKHNLTTRYQLTNGHYVTANKKFVIQGND
ncbi:hypothetical protein FAM21834_00368 [Lentilactobacillus parabuchneri]|uniref:DUF5776 domain-containing protein n=1 Tax=Lentilactobacillus parabuchneri TaxID=152331 RepID=A0A1X1FHB7_9LACO|nr:DUF5776 domain-containing protein [Lentilactobacillus parabuchneri]APR06637.1 hypothetical protein FAM21731_00422 [Lentilactobacillus parabuchneri]MDG9738303.1 DUF5776 domain-containing protein [Lentilactobacillus parabuchneri]OBU98356.1 hypothetical protein A7B51_11680 [Lentilactobacillus parabuchneri]OCB83366.1 hypothetical protein A8O18_10745 [Lentilactobacillus parabuchneri]ORN03509.1 hypothetical protein FAM21823_00476 [Lentilactobacillus parabuchneri]